MIDLVKSSFKSLYNKDAEIIVKAPSRINLIGEHTDYNGGLVLPAAIDKYMYFAFATNNTNVGNVYAKDLGKKAAINFDTLNKTDSVWVNYLIGILIEFKKRDVLLKGFDCVFSSDIPMGAGMSSSAALECGFAVGMNHINQSKFDNWDIINISHQSNHSFMNVYGGIMDQFASLFGRHNKCMLLNNSDRLFEYYDIDLEEYSIVLINTNVLHEHTTSGYNDRAADCKEIERRLAAFDPKLKKISDASIDIIEHVGRQWPEYLKNRAMFVINENERVRSFVKAMKKGDLFECGQLLYQSHYGLQYHFEVSCPELNMLVDFTRDESDILGARMMGGGFGGCTINLIKTKNAVKITQDIIDEYDLSTGNKAKSYFVNISDGANVVI